MKIFLKIFRYLLLLLIIISSLLLASWIFDLVIRVINPPPKISYGITFSAPYAESLGLNPSEAYRTILSDLGVKEVRIPVYWERVEKEKGKFDFSEVDKLLETSREKNVKVILAIGYRVPRWPECYPPAWAKDLSKEKLKPEILNLIKTSVEHFSKSPEIIAWQVENEPMLQFFGECSIFGEQFLKEEVSLVKNNDSRPVILTDSGELSLWSSALKIPDQMGTSLYQTVYNPWFGFVNYPFPPVLYRLKVFLVPKIYGGTSDIFISELQAEPWITGSPILNTSIEDQIKLFSINDFKGTTEFAANTHIKRQYLWGAEWWYFMKDKGYPEYWEFAKEIFR